MKIRPSRSSRGLVYFTLAVFALFMMPAGLVAKSPRPSAESGSITGFIYTKDIKAPVAGAVVKIRNIADMKEMASQPTDANGLYAITGVPEGRYLVGVTSAKSDFNLDYALYVKAGETGKLTIALGTAGGQETPSAAPAKKKKGFFDSVAGRVLVISAVGVGLYYLIAEPESSPIR